MDLNWLRCEQKWQPGREICGYFLHVDGKGDGVSMFIRTQLRPDGLMTFYTNRTPKNHKVYCTAGHAYPVPKGTIWKLLSKS